MKNQIMSTQGVRLKIDIQQVENGAKDNSIGRFNNVWLYVDFSSIRTIKNLHSAIRERFNLPKSRLFLQDFLLLPREPIEILKDDDLIIVKNKKCEAHENASRKRKISSSNDVSNQKVENGIVDHEDQTTERPKKKHKSNNFSVEDNIAHQDTQPAEKRKKKHKKNKSQDESIIADQDTQPTEKPKRKHKHKHKNPEENSHPKIPLQLEEANDDVAAKAELVVNGSEDVSPKRKRKRTRRKRKLTAIETELSLANEDAVDCSTREQSWSRFNAPFLPSLKERDVRPAPRNASTYGSKQMGRHIRFDQDSFDAPSSDHIENGYRMAHGEAREDQHRFSMLEDRVSEEVLRPEPVAPEAHFAAAKNVRRTVNHEDFAATNVANGSPNPVNVQTADDCLVKSPSVAVFETKSNQNRGSITVDGTEAPRDYNIYPALVGCPRIGDAIAFQELILTEDYTPEISPYREGVVKFYDPKDDLVVIRLKEPLLETRLCGKFEIDEFDEEEKEEEYITEMSRNLKCLLNPKLLKVVEISEGQ